MPSLGTLTYSVLADIGGFVDGMSKAERAAQKSTDAINKQIESIGVTSYAIGNALGQYIKEGLDLAASAFPNLIKQAADFQDIADKTGGSAEGFANFAVSAKVAGVSIETIATASTHLSKALLEAGDDSKSITAGLKALNIQVDTFKKLTPDEAIKTIANAFGNFADGAGKAAVAQQLFGRSGADLLKFFSDYVQSGGDVTILNGQMISKSDDFTDAMTRQRTEISLLASALATQAIDPITALTGTVKDAIGQFTGLSGATGDLAKNDSVKRWAEDAGRSIAQFLDYVEQSIKELKTLNDFGNALDASLKNFSLKPIQDFQDQNGLDAFFRGKDASLKTAEQGFSNMDALFGKRGTSAADSFANAYDKRLKDATSARDDKGTNAFYGIGADNRPQLNAHTPAKKGSGGDNGAAALAKSQLGFDLDDIKNIQKAQQDAVANNQKVLEAMHSAGLTSDQDYYAQRKQLLDQDTKAQVDALNAQIARLQDETFTGKTAAKDQVDNAKKIADAQAQLTKVQADSATQSKVLGIQEESTYRKMASALLSARQAAEAYFQTTNEGYARTLAGIGKGDKARDYLSQLGAVEDNYQRQRQQLQDQRNLAVANAGPNGLDPKVSDYFDKNLALIDEYNGKAIASFKSSYTAIDAAQKDWLLGATDALSNYADSAAMTGKLVAGVIDDAFSGLENTLTDFFSKGTADWRSFANSVITDIDRMVVKQLLLGPLADQIKGALGGGSSSGGGLNIGGIIGSIFGGGDAALTAANAVGAAGGDSLGILASLKANGKAGGGYTGPGGIYEPAGIVHKGEVVWSQSDVASAGGVGVVEAMRRGGGGPTQNVIINMQPGQVDRRTATQIANQSRRSILTAGVRMGS